MRISPWLMGCLLLAMSVVAGCDNNSTPKREGQPLQISHEFKGQQEPFPDPGYLVVQRPEVWQAVWGGKPPAAIDFTQQTVLVALVGQVPTAGYDVTITDVYATDKRVTAYVTQRRPGAKESVEKVTSFPYHMVVMPKLSTPVYLNVKDAAVQPTAIQDLFFGVRCSAEKPFVRVLRDQDSWRTFWTTNVNPAAMPPEIDFAQYMAVAVFVGQKPSEGYAVMITAVAQQDDRLLVYYRTHAPPPDAKVVEQATSPYSIAIVPTSLLPVVFNNNSPPLR